MLTRDTLRRVIHDARLEWRLAKPTAAPVTQSEAIADAIIEMLEPAYSKGQWRCAHCRHSIEHGHAEWCAHKPKESHDGIG